MRFQILDSNRYPLKGTAGKFIHLATISAGLREYMAFVDNTTGKGYVEEVTGGHLETIGDDSLFQELATFLQQQGSFSISHHEVPSFSKGIPQECK